MTGKRFRMTERKFRMTRREFRMTSQKVENDKRKTPKPLKCRLERKNTIPFLIKIMYT